MKQSTLTPEEVEKGFRRLAAAREHLDHDHAGRLNAGILEHRQHLAAEETRQQVDVREEVGAGGDRSRAVEREPSLAS
jgi:hypothetical protein